MSVEKNSRRARDLYIGRFPSQTTPSKNTFAYVEQKLRYASCPSGKQKILRRKPSQTQDNVINILAYLQVNSHISTRCLQQECGVSRITIQIVLKNHKYHPLKIHLTQGLTSTYPERRLNFIAEMTVKLAYHPLFLNKIL